MCRSVDVESSVTRCKIKIVVQMFSKVAQIISTAVFTLIDSFQNSPKVTNLFGPPRERICCSELSKSAQSGRTGGGRERERAREAAESWLAEKKTKKKSRDRLQAAAAKI